MVLRYVLGRTDNAAIQAERFKMLAGGAQLVAIGLLAASIVAPSFNPAIATNLLAKLAGGLAAGIMELLALRLMGYGVVVSVPDKADGHG